MNKIFTKEKLEDIQRRMMAADTVTSNSALTLMLLICRMLLIEPMPVDMSTIYGGGYCKEVIEIFNKFGDIKVQ